MQPASEPEQLGSNVSSGVKRDARAAELPDEDEQGGKFKQGEGCRRDPRASSQWKMTSRSTRPQKALMKNKSRQSSLASFGTSRLLTGFSVSDGDWAVYDDTTQLG